MATGARNGQSHQSARDDVDLIINHIVRIAKLHSDRQKTERGQLFCVVSQPELVGRELFNHKTIEGQVGIERPNNVVTVRVGKRKLFKTDGRSTVRVRIPCDV